MKDYLRGWTAIRITRLLMGVIIIVQGFQAAQWAFVAVGLLLTLMPLLSIGCCGQASCRIPTSKRREGKDTPKQEIC